MQIAKSAGAAVVAWQVATVALHSHQPFLAPLAALITVHATVYQSVRGAAQHVLAVLAGVLLAFLAARTLGVEWYSLGLVLVVALVIARWQRLGDSALQVPTTALLALTIAGGVRDTALEARVVETLVGAVIGAATNLLVLPPVHLRSSRDAIASIASGVARLLRSCFPRAPAGGRGRGRASPRRRRGGRWIGGAQVGGGAGRGGGGALASSSVLVWWWR